MKCLIPTLELGESNVASDAFQRCFCSVTTYPTQAQRGIGTCWCSVPLGEIERLECLDGAEILREG